MPTQQNACYKRNSIYQKYVAWHDDDIQSNTRHSPTSSVKIPPSFWSYLHPQTSHPCFKFCPHLSRLLPTTSYPCRYNPSGLRLISFLPPKSVCTPPCAHLSQPNPGFVLRRAKELELMENVGVVPNHTDTAAVTVWCVLFVPLLVAMVLSHRTGVLHHGSNSHCSI